MAEDNCSKNGRRRSHALSARRPYRDALPLPKVWEIMDKDAGVALDASCIDVLKNDHPALALAA